MASGSITVVVPTFRRPEGLARVLDALRTQEDPGAPWDVVIVDNDHPGASVPEPVLRADGRPIPIRVVGESRRGASHARNRGIAEATGEVIAFLDDDVVPAPDWLLRLTEPILAGRCDGTGGRAVLDPTVPRPSWFDEAGLGPYLAAHAPSDVERPVDDGEYVITASAAFRADLLRATGGFDPELGPRGGVQLVNDDVALGDRFMSAGGRLHHLPGAVVVHELPASRLRPGYLLRRAHSQGRSDWRMQAGTLGPREAARRQSRWVRHEIQARWREGPWRASVAMHAATDAWRVAGALREAATHLLARRHPPKGV